MLLAAAATARADTIALVSRDPAFHTALQDAGDQVIVMDEAAPPVSELAASSRTIANQVQADATVWLIAGRETSTLVTYDRIRDRMIVRDLPYTVPLDAARAVETARMVRTMLGSIRFVEPVTAPPPIAVLPPPPPEARFSLSLGGGVWVAAPAATATPSAAITAAWRPHALGIAVTAALAPSADVMKPSFTGDVRDTAVAIEVRNALVLQPRLYLVPAAGIGLHVLHIAGNTLDSRRYDPALRVGLSALYELPRNVETGLSVSADCLLRRQVYEAGNTEILAIPRVQIVTSLIVGIRL